MKKLICALALAAAASAFASFSYQGALRLADGTAAEGGPKVITFSLYATPADNNPLWMGKQAVVVAPSNGIFNVEISDSTPNPNDGSRVLLDDLLAQNENLYLGLFVEGSTGEIRPRQRLLPVPTASFARNVSRANLDFTVASNLVVNGAAKVARNLDVEGALGVEGGLKVDGNLTAGGTLTSGGVEVMPVPVGGIIMWSATTPPAPDTAWGQHWAICDGTKVGNVTTPDLRGRFIVGASQTGNKPTDTNLVYNIGTVGGANSVALTKAQMPNHSHLYPGDDSLSERNVFGAYNDGALFAGNAKNNFDFSSDGENKDRIYRTGTAGGDATDSNKGTDGFAEAHENRPPYYALYYIMRVK